MLFTKLNACCDFSKRCISLQLYAVNLQSHTKQGKADCYKLVEGIHSAQKHIQTYTAIANQISGMLEYDLLLTNQPKSKLVLGI